MTIEGAMHLRKERRSRVLCELTIGRLRQRSFAKKGGVETLSVLWQGEGDGFGKGG